MGRASMQGRPGKQVSEHNRGHRGTLVYAKWRSTITKFNQDMRQVAALQIAIGLRSNTIWLSPFKSRLIQSMF